MKKFLALAIGLGMAATVGQVALVSADCGGKHATQAAIQAPEKAVSQAPATATTEQVHTAQADKTNKPAPEVKK